jgi:hypothetical protein
MEKEKKVKCYECFYSIRYYEMKTAIYSCMKLIPDHIPLKQQNKWGEEKIKKIKKMGSKCDYFIDIGEYIEFKSKW